MSHPYPQNDSQMPLSGFVSEWEIAREILDVCDEDQKALVLFELEEYEGYLYGQANFKITPDGSNHWLFIRSFREIVEQRVLQKLKSQFGHELSHMLFLNEDLKAQFEKSTQTGAFKPLFRLVEAIGKHGDGYELID
jgi:hypothetical protein